MSRAVHLDEIPYREDSCELFERLRELPGAAMLDSSYPHSRAGRFDILTADPVANMPALAATADEHSSRQFFSDLAAFHQEHFAGIQPVSHDIPFCGGVLGYIGYGCGNSLHKIEGRDGRTSDVAASQMGAYQWCVIQDHLLQRSVLVSHPEVSPARRAELLRRLRTRRTGAVAGFALTEQFAANLSADQYRDAFERIQSYIRAGDCYQVNLAQRLSARFNGDPWEAYLALRQAAAAPFSAYLDLADNDAVISLSPERFIALHGHHVETSPIKGTRPRHSDPALDRAAAEALRNADKDRAENLMIVDLLRNDLGRSCAPGSIHVDRLFEIQAFPTVHHMVSTISGELRADRSVFDLLRDSFPGGSITGAPKRRAMEIIAELEPDSRQVYCGSVLYVSADGRMDSNIAIRTLLCRAGTIHCWAGGGIVADSICEQEYQETWDKVGSFLSLLEELPGRKAISAD